MTGKSLRPCMLWFTGLSGAGKSTLSTLVATELAALGYPNKRLDGDEMRATVCRDLGFSAEDRRENIRRIGAIAVDAVNDKEFAIVATISPSRASRDDVRGKLPAGDFVEIFVDAPLAVCERRDVKGLYQRARRGELPLFTGIGSEYERPSAPEIHLDTAHITAPQCLKKIMLYLQDRVLAK